MTLRSIACIVGTRPDAIKMAPVVSELKRRGNADVSVVSTGQHREMLQQALELFSIVPDHNLAIMTDGQTLEDITAQTLKSLPAVFDRLQPELVLVQGDTATAFASALSAFYSKIPVGHVEAGLRTYDKLSPFPEEMNRCLISSIADLHFAPTEGNRRNLIREGIASTSVFVTGNTVIDALMATAARDDLPITPIVRELELRTTRKVLVTAHRRENFGKPLANICGALLELCARFADVEFVVSIHPNPQAGRVVRQMLSGQPRITLLDAQEYSSFVRLLKMSYLILTDSGGIQEEAPALGIPVLVLRDVTERPEAVAAGTVRIIGTGHTQVVAQTAALLEDSAAYSLMAKSVNPAGDGHAAVRIVDTVLSAALT